MINKNKKMINGNSFNITQAIYEKLTVNIITNGENLKTFPLREKGKDNTYSSEYQKYQLGKLGKKKEIKMGN